MKDAELIDWLGGPAKVAELLGYDKSSGGIQRVHNWYSRGIPYRVKVEHPELMLLAQQAFARSAIGGSGVKEAA